LDPEQLSLLCSGIVSVAGFAPLFEVFFLGRIYFGKECEKNNKTKKDFRIGKEE
jgi:hypothetical protein